MSNNDIDPSILAELEEQAKHTKFSGPLRIKIEKGHTARIRILNAKIGPGKKFFVRLGWHWFNKRPYLCAKKTSEDLGGGDHVRCKICEKIDDLMMNKRKSVAQYAAKLQPMPMFLVYALLIEEDGDPVPKANRWLAHEFNMKKEAWNTFSAMLQYAIKHNKPSPLDHFEGRDLIIEVTNRGMIITKDDDRTPICNPDNFERVWDKITKSFPKFDYEFPSGDRLREVLLKIEDAAYKYEGNRDREDDEGGDRGERRSSSREDDEPRRSHEDDEPRRSREDDEPAPRKSRPEDDEPAPRKASRPPADEDDEPPRRATARNEDDEPRRPARREDDERDNRRPARNEDDINYDHPDKAKTRTPDRDEEEPPRKARPPEDDDEPPRRPAATRERDREEDEPPRRPSASRPPADEDDERPTPPSSRKLDPPPASARPAATGKPAPAMDEDEDLPNEKKDQAPAIRETVPDDDGPPPKAEAPKTGGLSSKLKESVGRLTATED